MSASSFEIQMMKRVLELADSVPHSVLPNPRVGAVITYKNRIVGEGFHRGPGFPHAEVAAIQNAKKRGFKNFKAAEIFINLEPCCHLNKRTPPCAPLLISKNFKRVVVAHLDPNPEVSGRGLRALKRFGIPVKVGVLKKEAERINQAFIKNQKAKLPYITLKIAMTFDGKLADDFGKSQWITSEKSRDYVQTIRARVDAIAVGKNTIDSDNPALNARPKKSKPQPKIILVFGKPRLSIQKTKAAKANSAKNIVIVSSHRPLKATLRCLYLTENIRHILLEGGPTLASRFLKEKLVDEVYLFTGRGFVGGLGRFTIGHKWGASHLNNILRFLPSQATLLDHDVLTYGTFCNYAT